MRGFWGRSCIRALKLQVKKNGRMMECVGDGWRMKVDYGWVLEQGGGEFNEVLVAIEC